MICGKEYHGECHKEPSCINCGGKHKATDKKRCVVYEYNLNLKKTMADRNISIHEAKKIVKRPNLHTDIEWRKELSMTEEEENRMREFCEKRMRNWHWEDSRDRGEQRSYSEVVRSLDNSREERDEENKQMKKRAIGKEQDSMGNKGSSNNSLELELRSSKYTNLTSVTSSTRYLSEEIKKMYKVMEDKLKIMDENFEKFQEMQLRVQQEFFERFLRQGIDYKKKT